MANSEFIDVISPSALADIEAVNAKIVKTIELSKEANKNLIGAKSPSSSDSAIKSLNAELLKSQKLYADLQMQLGKLTEKQNQNTKSAKQMEAQSVRESTARNALNKQRERELSLLERSNNVYNKVQAKVNQLSATYNNLAIKRELGLKLNDREVAQLTSLETRLNKYQGALKAVDASIQKNQRNVGNYASGWNGLGNSINQITRELPAFTFSAQTGFLALSNNIPILTDEISKLSKANKELVAQGQPVKSVFSQILSSFLSWQTAMGVGILLFTMYGKEIGDFASKLFKTSSSIDALKESKKQLNDITQEGVKNSVEETIKLKSLLSVAQDTTLTYTERMIAVKELQSTYPAYFGNLKEEQILAGNTATAERDLTNAIIARAKANAAISKITELQKQVIDLELQGLDLTNKRTEAQRLNNQAVASSLGDKSRGDAVALRSLQTTKNIDVVEKEIIANNKEKLSLQQVINKLSEFAIANDKKSILLKYQDTTATKDNTDAKKSNNDEKKKEVELLKGSESWYEKQISLLKELRSTTADTTEEYKSFDAQLAILEDGLKALRGELTALEGEGLKLDFEKMGLTPEGFQKFTKDGKDSVEEMTDDWKKSFQDWAQVALDAINTVQQAQQQANERELYNLEKQRDTAILFAGESADARAEVDRQYDEKRRALLNRQAKQDKALAITQAIINTAGAVIAGLKTSIPYAIAVGVIGAAQIALIASQQIPQFYKGTDNAPEGLAWTQEKGAELITDKKGNIKSYGSNKGAQMTYLNKGDKVFTAKETKDIMFNNELNGILTNNGISNSIVNNNVDLSPLNTRLDNLASIIKNKSEVTFVRDIQGERVYKREQGQKKVLVSNRLRIKP